MKYYKVIKDNFLWEDGAILTETSDNEGYRPISDIYKKSEFDNNEYTSSGIVENSPEYFARVYKVDLISRTLYEVKEEAIKILDKQFKK